MTGAARSVANKSRGSIRTQLIIGTIVGLTLILVLFGVFVRYVVTTTLMASVDRDLQERVTQMLRRPPPPRPGDDNGPQNDGGQQQPAPPPPPPLDQQYGGPQGEQNDQFPPRQQYGGGPPFQQGQPGSDQGNGGRNLPGGIYRPRRFRLDGSTLDRFNSSPAWDNNAIRTAATSDAPVFTTITRNSVHLRVLTRAVQHPGRPEWFVQAPYPLTQVDSAINGVDRALLLLIPIALLTAGLGGAFLTRSILTRVGQMVHSAARIGAENLSQRLPVDGNDEFAELAVTFNALLSRVELAFLEQVKVVEQQRRFTADASHELKTPLTVIRGTTSLALTDNGILDRQSTIDIDDAAAQMSDLVQDLIYLARSDAGQLGRERIDLLLIEPLQTSVDRVSSMFEVPIKLVAANEYLTVNASESELVRLFTNILLNAANHTPSDGRILVSLSSTKSEAIVMINDTGVGISPEHIEHLCERFYRIDSARSQNAGGTGLGLAICKGIVEANAGTLTIESVLGKGTTVTVTLPRIPSAVL